MESFVPHLTERWYGLGLFVSTDLSHLRRGPFLPFQTQSLRLYTGVAVNVDV
jgi:hypothetical protein